VPRHQNKNLALYMRNLIFGAEDSLVSTVGLLSGVAIGGVPGKTIVLTGIVLVFVEAFSMGVGSFLSESSLEESVNGDKAKSEGSMAGAGIMFLSYMASGLVPLWPYLALDGAAAFWGSILSALAGLFVLGYVSARLLGIRAYRSAFRMAMIGGVAIGIGALVGKLVGIN
jgi:vacuolar iron transporter family protein